ncbi:Hypothetical protein FKW44_022827, partial [Caligus rogercresseyi]
EFREKKCKKAYATQPERGSSPEDDDDPGLGSSETDESLESEWREEDEERKEERDSGSEDTISLQCIKDSLIMHRYAAARGQREKELEICEVRPHKYVAKTLLIFFLV